MARYWRVLGIQTPSNSLALSAFALSDGTTDYSTATLTGALGASFAINWDLGSDIAIDRIKLTSITEPDFPTTLFFESSADGIAWAIGGLLQTITYPGDATLATVVFNDPHMPYTPLLLRGDSTFADSSLSPKTATAVGNAQISSVQSKFGGASMLFDGTGDYLTVTPKTEFALQLSDFTVEGWFYQNVLNAFTVALEIGSAGSSTGIAFVVSNSGFAGVNSGAFAGSKATTPGTWQHVAWVRHAGVLTVYVGGVGSTPVAFTNNLTDTNTVTVGAYGSSPGAFGYAGYIDDLRVTKGLARYTANFTPPAVAHPGASTGTSVPVVKGVMAHNSVVTIPDGGTMPTAGPAYAPSGVVVTDVLDGGTYEIVGTVAEKNPPTDLPLSRRVTLIEERSRRTVRETWSDTAGDYVFPDINGSYKYTVLAYDHEHDYRAVVADNLTPTLQ